VHVFSASTAWADGINKNEHATIPVIVTSCNLLQLLALFQSNDGVSDIKISAFSCQILWFFMRFRGLGKRGMIKLQCSVMISDGS
jgi:hypothetical protein